MLLYPDLQRVAQEEIDRVVGNDRLPDFEDKDSLPLITAMMKETLRCALCTAYKHIYSRTIQMATRYPAR